MTSRARTFPIRGRVHISLHGAGSKRYPHRIGRNEAFGPNKEVAGAIGGGREGTSRSVEDNHRDAGGWPLGRGVHENGARNAECGGVGRRATFLMAKETRLAGTMQRSRGDARIFRSQRCDRLVAKGVSARRRREAASGYETCKGNRGTPSGRPSLRHCGYSGGEHVSGQSHDTARLVDSPGLPTRSELPDRYLVGDAARSRAHAGTGGPWNSGRYDAFPTASGRHRTIRSSSSKKNDPSSESCRFVHRRSQSDPARSACESSYEVGTRVLVPW